MNAIIRHRMADDLRRQSHSIRDELRAYGHVFKPAERRKLDKLALDCDYSATLIDGGQRYELSK